MQPNKLGILTADRSSWRTLFKKLASVFAPIHSLQEKRTQPKIGHQPLIDHCFTCDICRRICASRIGWVSHRRTHAAFILTRDQYGPFHTKNNGNYQFTSESSCLASSCPRFEAFCVHIKRTIFNAYTFIEVTPQRGLLRTPEEARLCTVNTFKTYMEI